MKRHHYVPSDLRHEYSSLCKVCKKARVHDNHRECQEVSFSYGSYGYPCRRIAGHEGPHEVLDKDDCPHMWRAGEVGK